MQPESEKMNRDKSKKTTKLRSVSASKHKFSKEKSISSYKTPLHSGQPKGSFHARSHSIPHREHRASIHRSHSLSVKRKKTFDSEDGASFSNSDESSDDQSNIRNGLFFYIKRSIKNPSLVQLTILSCLVSILMGSILHVVGELLDWTKIIIELPGQIFIRALKLLVTPMILINMILVPVKLGDITKAQKIGKKVILFYLSTTFFAAFEGLIVSNLIKPGTVSSGMCLKSSNNIDISKGEDKDAVSSILKIFYFAIDDNLVSAFLNLNLLGLIVFGLWFGFNLGPYISFENGRNLMANLDTINEVLFDMIRFVINFTPVGIFSLILTQLINIDDPVCIMKMMGSFIGTVLLGNVFHWLVIYPAIYFIFTRQNAYAYYLKITQAMMTAFAAASSAAALPVTLKCNIENCGVSEETASFVLPLGATINMDGTAIYYPIAIIFFATITQQKTSLQLQIVIAVVSSFVSIGAAPIPSAGLIYLLAIINSVNLKATPAISLILGVDWLMDRIQVVVNICGDSLAASIIDRQLSKEEEKMKNKELEKSRV